MSRKFHMVVDVWVYTDTPGQADRELRDELGKTNLEWQADAIFGEVINEDQDEQSVSADMP